MAKKVVVHDIDSLQSYCKRLGDLRIQIMSDCQELKNLSEELRTKSSTMHSLTEAQANNWRDPQYEVMKDAVTQSMTALSINANSMNETSSIIVKQMETVDSSIGYIRGLIRKLRS